MTDPKRRDILRFGTLIVGGSSTLAGCGGDAASADPSAGPPLAAASPDPALPRPKPPGEPPPTPAPGSPQFTLRAATTQTAPFCVGFAVRKGDIPAGTAIAVTGAIAQATVKNVWPDGSAKFAIVAGTAALTANTPATVTLAPGAALTGRTLTVSDLQAQMGQAVTVGAGSYGSASWTGTDWTKPFQAWVAGPRMSSWIYRKPIGSDAHLVAWLEVRLWSTGAVEVLPWIENGYLQVANPTDRPATYSFTMGGRSRFSQAFTLPSHCRTPLINGTATSYWLAADPDVIVKHDINYMQNTGLVPAYFPKVTAAAAAATGLPTSFAPLQRGNYDGSGLASGGFHNHIGLVPAWDALYLASDASLTYKGLVFQGYSAGRYPFHFRDETTHRPPRPSAYPTLGIHAPGPGWFVVPVPASTVADDWSVTHQPSIGFVPYLVTGRWYFMDEVQQSALSNYLYTPYTWREQAKGILKSQSLTTRGHAWALRTLAQAMCATPDDDTVLRGELATQMKENIDWLHSRYVAKPNNPLGFITPYGDYNGGTGGYTTAGCTTTKIIARPGALYGAPYNLTADNQYVGWTVSIAGQTRTITGYVMATETLTVSPPLPAAPADGTLFFVNDSKWFEAAWMQDFVTASWGYAKDLGAAPDDATRTKLDALFAWKARSVVGRFGGTGATEFLYRDGAPYTISIAPSDAPDFNGGTGPWYQNFGQVYAATFGGKTPLGGGSKPPAYASPGPKVEGPLRDWLSPEGYLANALPAIAYSVKHGAVGAQAAYQRLTSASNWGEFLRGFETQPVWGVAPGAVATPPPPPPETPPGGVPVWRRGQGVNEWREIPGSSLAAGQPPTNVARQLNGVGAVVGWSARMDAWCGLSIDTRSSKVWSAANGGHGDYFGNEVATIDLMSDTPTWVEWCAGSKGNVVDHLTPATHPSHARYTDGLPCSTHSYYGQQFIERHNRAIRLGGSTSPIGSAFENVESFDVSKRNTSGWDRAGTYGMCLGNINGGWTPAIGWCACKDPSNENIYVVSAPYIRRFVPSPSGVGGTWSVLSTIPNGLNTGALGATAVDTKRNRLMWLKGYGPNNPYTCDLGTGAWTSRVCPNSAAKTELEKLTQSLGMVYVPQLDAYLVRANAAGGKVYRIDAATFAVSMLSTSNGNGVPQSLVLSNEENVYNRWLLVPGLQGVVYFARASHNAWFLRLY